MTTADRILYAQKSLAGVAIGDAFGESFFGEADKMWQHIVARTIPETSWQYTDDTIMSIAVLEELELNGAIDQDRLVRKFCSNHNKDANRGYGATLRSILRSVEDGAPWREAAGQAFDGQGSMGNGAAMRVCPIGAYYPDDFETVKKLAVQSAEVTHANPEAIAGAIAIATGTALATRMQRENNYLQPVDFIKTVADHTPPSDTKSKIMKSVTVLYNAHIETVKTILGNGTNMTAQDTVPFSVWCAAHNLDNFEEALWKAVSILGDRDTICAMVGGMTIMSSKPGNIPATWVAAVEPFEKSQFRSAGR